MAVDVKELMDELHIDSTDEETNTLTTLITEAEAIIKFEVDSDGKSKTLETNPIYDLAVKTLATELYYDRNFSVGNSKGMILMLDLLYISVQKELAGASDGSE